MDEQARKIEQLERELQALRILAERLKARLERVEAQAYVARMAPPIMMQHDPLGR